MPTLGIGLELLTRSPVRPESLSRQAPAPGALNFVIRACASFRVVIYASRPGRGRGAAIQFWLLRAATRHFNDADDPHGGRAAALELIDTLAFTDARPPQTDAALELGSSWYRGPGLWPSIDELLAAAERVETWWRDAA